jgi:hypothetical protein
VDFADRFDPDHYRTGEPVELRTYRRARSTPVYRDHAVVEELFVRAVLLARAYDLRQLAKLDSYGQVELNKQQARRLSDELAFLQSVVNDSLLEPHLAAMQEVADSCWRTTEAAWLVVEGA